MHSRKLVPVIALVAGIGLGVLLGGFVEPAAMAGEEEAEPVYVIVSGQVIDATGLDAYGEAAGPAAQAAGIEVLARREVAEVEVVEGNWPFDGFVAVERFRSMDDFLAFWNSPEYQAAIKLREGKVSLDFVVALSGAAE